MYHHIIIGEDIAPMGPTGPCCTGPTGPTGMKGATGAPAVGAVGVWALTEVSGAPALPAPSGDFMPVDIWLHRQLQSFQCHSIQNQFRRLRRTIITLIWQWMVYWMAPS